MKAGQAHVRPRAAALRADPRYVPAVTWHADLARRASSWLLRRGFVRSRASPADLGQISGLLAWYLVDLRGVPGQIHGRNELLLSQQLMRFHALEGASLGHRRN